jgi:peptidoglycan/xylan/chitin deacetylase (PgdA/CDA1 family)
MVERGLRAGPVLRVVNYHRTPARRADQYERDFALYAEHFSPVAESDLDLYLATGTWMKAKPGLILAFYDGSRSNYDVARPLLERHGLVGWFFIVTGFVGTPDVAAFAARHRIRFRSAEEESPALSWDEVAHLAENHVVASHTRGHTAALAEPDEDLESEIVGSQEDFRRGIGRPVSALAWRGGAPLGRFPQADAQVRRAGYRVVFSNLQVQRVP